MEQYLCYKKEVVAEEGEKDKNNQVLIRYAYCRNNLVRSVDPSGHETESLADKNGGESHNSSTDNDTNPNKNNYKSAKPEKVVNALKDYQTKNKAK